MQLCVGLECVVQGDKEGVLSDHLQHLSLSLGVLRGLGLLYDAGFLEDLHGIQLVVVSSPKLTDQEHLTIG